ncbi:MAG TPA: nucleotidyltransferase domain-containing protein [Thermoanaerobaculia bacterium]|nr:nucleotidyltransferase domain-containing protein [Thermoanaerobaculia bacterium]
MQRIIAERRQDLADLCRRFGVRRLELFGSATGKGFDPDASDVDFLVDFHPVPHGVLADNYLGLLEALEALFGKPVDLVMIAAVRNPYFLQGIEPSRTLLYAA